MPIASIDLPVTRANDADGVEVGVAALAGPEAGGRVALDELNVVVAILDRVDDVLDCQVLVEVDEVLALAALEDRVGVRDGGGTGSVTSGKPTAGSPLMRFAAVAPVDCAWVATNLGDHTPAAPPARDTPTGRLIARCICIASSKTTLAPAWLARFNAGAQPTVIRTQSHVIQSVTLEVLPWPVMAATPMLSTRR